MNHSVAGMVILNPYKKNFKLDRDIYFLLGIDQRLQERNLTGRFTSLNSNLFYCDLLDKDENLFNGEPTSVLGCFDIAESQFERVNYSLPTPMLEKHQQGMISCPYKVSDKNKEIINFCQCYANEV